MDLLECHLAIDDIDSFVSDIGAIGDQHGTTIQAFDARYVADRAHLERAVELADRAITRGENVARDRAVEILLYAAGRRQIDRALEMGVDEGEGAAVILVAAADGAGADAERATIESIDTLDAVVAVEPTLSVDETERAETIREFFEITDAECKATDASIGALVRERVALLDVEK